MWMVSPHVNGCSTQTDWGGRIWGNLGFCVDVSVVSCLVTYGFYNFQLRPRFHWRTASGECWPSQSSQTRIMNWPIRYLYVVVLLSNLSYLFDPEWTRDRRDSFPFQPANSTFRAVRELALPLEIFCSQNCGTPYTSNVFGYAFGNQA